MIFHFLEFEIFKCHSLKFCFIDVYLFFSFSHFVSLTPLFYLLCVIVILFYKVCKNILPGPFSFMCLYVLSDFACTLNSVITPCTIDFYQFYIPGFDTLFTLYMLSVQLPIGHPPLCILLASKTLVSSTKMF